MKILLVLPPITLEERYNKAIIKAAGSLPPLGILYLAAVLKQNNQVRVFDGSMKGYSQLLRLINRFKPDFIGIQGMTLFWPTIKNIVPKIKSLLPEAHISLGGALTYLNREKCLKELKELDSIVIGEGEETIVELTDHLEKNQDLRDVKGIMYRSRNKILKNKARQLIKDLDKLPFPAREFVDVLKYTPAIEQYKRKPVTNIITMRGCPYKCLFCAKAMDDTVRFRSAENVIEEIRFLVDKYSIRGISIWDDIFTLNKKRAIKILRKIRKEKLDIIFSAHSRVDLIDKPLLREMKKAGCWKIFYGVESMLQKNLDMLKKGTTLNQIHDAIKWTKSEDIETEISVMFGIPGETYPDCLETIKRVIKLDPDYAKFTYFTPYGNLKNKMEKYGEMIDFNLKNHNEIKLSYVPNSITKEQLQTILPKAYKDFYFRPNYILKRLSNLRCFEDVSRAIKGIQAVRSL